MIHPAMESVGLSDPLMETEVDDRRLCERRACALDAVLIDEQGRAIESCKAVNIGERGARLNAPAGDVRVGRRFEVLFHVRPPGREWSALPVEGCWGTVVRTEPLKGGSVGVAIYFDQPLFL
ncbi:MAG: PilZ domain-containing protein [Phycisphaerales bacterium]|nr:MAG: PilZ domain-containing protein [Phycisphaerales bacterium]